MKKKLLSALLVLVLAINVTGCGKKKTEDKKISVDNAQIQLDRIKNICELATLKCRYHNVARSTKVRDFNLIQKDVKFWIEYDSVAEISFDGTKIGIDVSDDNKVTVILPEPDITCTIDPDSWSESKIIKSKSGIIKLEIKSDDIQEAMANSEADMLDELTNNSGLISAAELQAQDSIKAYINKMGKINNINYEVKFQKASDSDADEKATEED